MGSVGFSGGFLGWFQWWNGRGMVEDEGWLLGGFGGAIWRSMKAGKGFGLLENEEVGWLWISGGKGEEFGWRMLGNWRPLSGMPRRTLRHSFLTLFSGIRR